MRTASNLDYSRVAPTKSSALWAFPLICCCLSVSSHALWGQSPAAKPATAIQAAKVLDLSRFELIDPDGEANFRVIAGQSYRSKAKLTDVAQRIREQLKQAGCEELDGATFTDAYGSASYRKQGFSFSLTLSPGAGGEGSSVTLINHGNVSPQTLPVPEQAELQFGLPSMAMYVTTTPVEEVQQELRKQLVEAGWEPFGETAVSFFMKQNAVRLQVMVSKSPAQANKTSIQMTTEQLSVDLPVPPYSGMLQYSDQSGGLLFDSDKTQEELVAYFKEALAQGKWEATTTAPVRIGFRDHLIFRNPAKEYLELKFNEVEGKRRVDMRYQTAEQFAATEEKATAAVEKKKMENIAAAERQANPAKLALPAPTAAKAGKMTGKNLEFSTESGAAAVIIATWLKAREAEGWKVNKVVDMKEAGVYKLSQEGRELHIDFVDPGFIPGRISIKAFGNFELELKK